MWAARAVGYGRRMPRMRRASALALSALAFAAAGCGDGEDTSGGEQPENQAPQQDQATPDPAEGTPAPEGSPYGETGEREPEGSR